MATIVGTDGNDLLVGILGETNSIFGNDGNDDITGGDLGDFINAGPGDDHVEAGDGNDFINDGIGSDVVDGGGGSDLIDGTGDSVATTNHLSGGPDDDTFFLDNPGPDIIDGGSGSDTVDYYQSVDSVRIDLSTGEGHGTAAGDTYVSVENASGSPANDRLIGNAQANFLSGEGGDDVLWGGPGADNLSGGDGINTLDYRGSPAGVLIDIGQSTASGGDAEGDRISIDFQRALGSAFGDRLAGANADNLFKGYGGNDLLFGRNGADTLYGGTGNDYLDGGTGNDMLNAGSGNDALNGAEGVDALYGGAGADRFEFRKIADSGPAPGQRDTIEDFSRHDGDKIDLSDIDANPSRNGNQAFIYAGHAGFGGHHGEVRWTTRGDGLTVWADTDGDRHADFAITVADTKALHLSDFML